MDSGNNANSRTGVAITSSFVTTDAGSNAVAKYMCGGNRIIKHSLPET